MPCGWQRCRTGLQHQTEVCACQKEAAPCPPVYALRVCIDAGLLGWAITSTWTPCHSQAQLHHRQILLATPAIVLGAASSNRSVRLATSTCLGPHPLTLHVPPTLLPAQSLSFLLQGPYDRPFTHLAISTRAHAFSLGGSTFRGAVDVWCVCRHAHAATQPVARKQPVTHPSCHWYLAACSKADAGRNVCVSNVMFRVRHEYELRW